MPDPNTPQMAVSHNQGVRFTPEELKYMAENDLLTPEVAHKLHPSDLAAYKQLTIDYLRGKDAGGLSGENNSIIAGSVAGGAALTGATAAPAILGAAAKMAPKGRVGAAVTGGVGSYLGFEGARGLASAMGLPRPLQDILGIAGAHLGGGMGHSNEVPSNARPGNSSRTLPMSASEFESVAGRPRAARREPGPATATPQAASPSGKPVPFGGYDLPGLHPDRHTDGFAVSDYRPTGQRPESPDVLQRRGGMPGMGGAGLASDAAQAATEEEQLQRLMEAVRMMQAGAPGQPPPRMSLGPNPNGVNKYTGRRNKP